MSSGSFSSSADDNMMNAKIDNFLKKYYEAFDDNPVGLFDMYPDDTEFTMDGEKVKGKMKVLHKLNSNYFRMCTHRNIKFGYQPLADAGFLVSVVGSVMLPGQPEQTFFQTLRLTLDSKGNLLVANDIFIICHAGKKP